MEYLSMRLSKGSFWIRVFDRGISIRNQNQHPLTFSEREGMTKFLRLGDLVFKLIRAQNEGGEK